MTSNGGGLFLVVDELASGALVRLLDQHPTPSWPIHALYSTNRHLPPKARALLEFLAGLLSG